jgi:pimeloyl-ACP methyl ester carboxylesterase
MNLLIMRSWNNPKFCSILKHVASCVGLFLFFQGVALGQGPLPCRTGALTTGDSKYPQQLIQICIPPSGWNGQLVVYAHGFVPPQAPLALPTAEFELFGGQTILAPLLQGGFAFATTSFRKNGYPVEQAAQDIEDLVRYFRTIVAPARLEKTFLVGGSEGGSIITLLLEQFPRTYDGGLALCSPLGGSPYQIKYLGDFRVAFDYFFPTVFRDEFRAFDVPTLAFQKWGDVTTGYVQEIASALAANPYAAEQLFKVTNLALDPQDVTGSALAATIRLLAYSIFETPDLIAAAGGVPFDNRLTFYHGSNNDFALNFRIERVTSTPAARDYVREFYQPTGRLRRPLVSLHTTLDPVAPFNHELLYFGLATLAGHRDSVTILPVPRYGHCNFQAAEVLGAFGLLLQKAQ